MSLSTTVGVCITRCPVTYRQESFNTQQPFIPHVEYSMQNTFVSICRQHKAFGSLLLEGLFHTCTQGYLLQEVYHCQRGDNELATERAVEYPFLSCQESIGEQ